jgi:hypothetical protein
MFFQIQLDDVEGAVFIQRLRIEEQTENVASAQNGLASTTLPRQIK